MKTRNALDALMMGALMALLAGCSLSVRGVNAPATATPTLPQPTDTSAPQQLTFVQDPMSILDEFDWSQGGACGSMQPGGFELNASQVCVAPDQITSFRDGTVSITAQQTSGTLLQGYALIFRAQGPPGS